jgi:UDP-N-acetyl-D-glucosamine dehydrogenase
MTAVAVTGLGYIGLPLAMQTVMVGDVVIGHDADEVWIKRLEAGKSYIEDAPSCQRAAALRAGRLGPSASADACVGFDVAAITVAIQKMTAGSGEPHLYPLRKGIKVTVKDRSA